MLVLLKLKLLYLLIVVSVSIEGGAHVSVDESGGYVEVCVMADHDSQASYEVMVSTTSVSATGSCHQTQESLSLSRLFLAGGDYVEVNKRLVFAFGFATRQCVDIPILVDECLEQTESFNVSLSSEQDCVEFGLAEIQVYIEEDDGN